MKVKSQKIFNLVSTFKAANAEDGGVLIRGMASTSDIDRAGDVIAADAWTKGGLANYKNNPIILFNHNYHKPVGRATDLKVRKNGLEIEAKISKAAPNKVCQLIKDGVLGAFSVGFLVKDADYSEETDGFKIKDAELFEVSVVSVPMNQAATFSLAKSFDSREEYEDFKKTFTNRVDLASQSLAKEEDTSSHIARNTLDGTSAKDVQKEIKMSGENNTPLIDLDAVAQRVAEEVAAKDAMRRATEEAQQKAAKEAADKAEQARQAQKTEIDQAVKAGLSGAEKLVEDLRSELNQKDAQMEEVLNKYKEELEAKTAEMQKIRESKRIFADRGGNAGASIKEVGKELMYAHMLGVMTRKGWDTDYAKNLMEKAGIDYVTNAPDIDQEVSNQIEKEITVETKVAPLFRQFPVNGAATVLPIQPDTGLADWAINATSGNLENRGASNNTYQPKQVILNAYRLVSSTYMDNDVDEQVLVNLMPMLVEGVSRAHARTVDRTILIGDGTSAANIGGLHSFAATHSEQIDLDATSVGTNSAVMTSAILLNARKGMGKYGLKPEELVYIVSQNSYYDLLSDGSFQTLDEVGPMAIRLTGSVGAVYGTPVVVSDEFATESAGNSAAFVVYRRNYVIPRLRGIKVEQDYEVMNQRRVIVASQALGFEELLAGDGSGTEPSMKVTFVA